MKFITADIETPHANSYEISMIGVWNGIEGAIYSNVTEFATQTFKKYGDQRYSVYFHYGGGFDFLYLLRELLGSRDFKLLGLVDIGGLIIQFTCLYYSRQLEFRDSFGLFRSSLNSLSKNLLGERKIELDSGRLSDYSRSVVEEYCIRDCKLLFESLTVFREEIKRPLKLTAPQQALDNFISFHCDRSIFDKLNNYHVQLFRDWYFGGHVDVYKRYGENLTSYDITNCYGYAMKQYGGIFGTPKKTDRFNDRSDRKGLYRISCDDQGEFPHLAAKHENKLMFFNSKRIFHATSLDLQHLEGRNIGYKVHDGFCFDYDKKLFASFIDYWYDKRFKSKRLKFISKLMINSLYGKFGQKTERLVTVVGDDCDYYYDKKYKIGRKLKKSIQWFSQPSLAAFITSGARCTLHKYVNKYADHLYYTDTDSIFIDTEIDTCDFHESALGKLKIEKEIKRGYFLAPKFYGVALTDKTFQCKLKGFDKDFTEEQFERALGYDLDFKERIQKMVKFKTALISHHEWVKFVTVQKEVKELKLKRRLLSDNLNTEAFREINGNLH